MTEDEWKIIMRIVKPFKNKLPKIKTLSFLLQKKFDDEVSKSVTKDTPKDMQFIFARYLMPKSLKK